MTTKSLLGIQKIIDFVSTHSQWEEYVSKIFNWLRERVQQVREEDTESKSAEALAAVDSINITQA